MRANHSDSSAFIFGKLAGEVVARDSSLQDLAVCQVNRETLDITNKPTKARLVLPMELIVRISTSKRCVQRKTEDPNRIRME
jgi:hypothetical protein